MTHQRSERDDERVSRLRGQRAIKTTVLIVGEGRETEPNYFNDFKREVPVARDFAITVKKGKGGSRVQIVKEAINRMKEPGKKYDESWCVMDVERLETQDQKEDLRQAIKLAHDNRLELCLSNPSIEVWFLAHFRRTGQSFNDADAVIEELDKHWQAVLGLAYEKNDRDVYRRLRTRTQDAVRNARDVHNKDHGGKTDIADCNSSTAMYLLIEKLLPQQEP